MPLDNGGSWRRPLVPAGQSGCQAAPNCAHVSRASDFTEVTAFTCIAVAGLATSNALRLRADPSPNEDRDPGPGEPRRGCRTERDGALSPTC